MVLCGYSSERESKKNLTVPAPHAHFVRVRNTRLLIYHGTGEPDYVKVWRGQRSLAYKCLDCGQNFYAREPQGRISEENLEDGPIIDDEEALRAAGKNLKDKPKRTMTIDADRKVCLKIEITIPEVISAFQRR